ncbi:MAG: MBL fold metallo-hydrolase [Pyrinomonadaceae bacterium MAG19_C2-C3]|nr:MBL fold metallo-hydrolase [Pyrinomonadaceae bacterium MAG19_C2-C3]
MNTEQRLDARRHDEPLTMTNELSDGKPPALTQLAPDVWCLRDKIVNLFFVGSKEKWMLVDTGLYGSASTIKRTAEKLFGANTPQFIFLTHGHFDHVGAVKTLAEEWNVAVYAHERELPFLTGRESYPPPDPTVGGGMMAASSFLYPRSPIDLGERVKAVNGERVHGFDEWQILHTPGHTQGHVSLFRERDRFLIAGDAFVTTKQESLTAVFTQKVEFHGPPAYFTPDWISARTSVEKLARLKPDTIATGHGQPLRGAEMQQKLETLARDFDRIAVPAQGRYVPESLKREADKTSSPVPVKVLIGIAVIGLGALCFGGKSKSSSRKFKRRAPRLSHSRDIRTV